ncbi:MAG: hypothetical protein ABMB14_12720 [Myxococcota bacterium]
MKPLVLQLREGAPARWDELAIDRTRVDALERVLAEESRASGQPPIALVDRVRRRVVASDRVGFVASRGFVVEVLPKFSGVDTVADVRQRFLQLLAWSGLAEWPPALASDAELYRRPLPDLLVNLFQRELRRRLAKGPYRAYRGASGNSPVVRGRIAMAPQLRQGDPDDRIACTWRTFDVDVDLNRILAAAVRVVHREGARGHDLLALLGDDVGWVDPRAAARLGVTWDRRSEPWRPLVNLARILLANGGVGWGHPSEAL